MRESAKGRFFEKVLLCTNYFLKLSFTFKTWFCRVFLGFAKKARNKKHQLDLTTKLKDPSKMDILTKTITLHS